MQSIYESSKKFTNNCFDNLRKINGHNHNSGLNQTVKYFITTLRSMKNKYNKKVLQKIFEECTNAIKYRKLTSNFYKPTHIKYESHMHMIAKLEEIKNTIQNILNGKPNFYASLEDDSDDDSDSDDDDDYEYANDHWSYSCVSCLSATSHIPPPPL